MIVSVVMSERSERKKFFLKRDVGRLTVGAGEPVRLIGGAVDRGCDRRCAGVAVVEGESAQNWGRALRGGGVTGVAGVRAFIKGFSKFFWVKFFGF